MRSEQGGRRLVLSIAQVGVHPPKTYIDREEARGDVFNYIEMFYNRNAITAMQTMFLQKSWKTSISTAYRTARKTESDSLMSPLCRNHPVVCMID